MPDTNFDITQPYLGLIQKFRPDPKIAEEDINSQRKIAKGNAVAEAFRILVDAVGGSKGANIQQRDNINPVMKAVDNYYKLKDASKQEQSKWDMAELGAGMDALKTESQNRFSSQKQKEAQDFQAEQSGLTRKQQAEQFAAGQQSDQGKVKQQAEQFRQEMGLKREMAKTDAEIEREKIQADRERVQAMYPYNKLTGMAIADEETDSIIRVPDAAIEQTLAFMEADPRVQDQIGFIKAKFNNLGSTQEVKYLIAQNFSMLSPETKQRIRALAEGSAQKTATPQQQPTIKTDKNSTMVQVNNPPAPQNNQPLAPEQLQSIQKIIGASNYSAEVKRSAVYRYLVEQGFDANSAKAAAESVYQTIISK